MAPPPRFHDVNEKKNPFFRRSTELDIAAGRAQITRTVESELFLSFSERLTASFWAMYAIMLTPK